MLSKLLFSLCFKEKKFFTQRCTAGNIAFWKPAPAPAASVTMNRASVNQHEPTLYPPNFRVHRFPRRRRDRRLCHFSFQGPKRGVRCFSVGFHALDVVTAVKSGMFNVVHLPIYERSCSVLTPFNSVQLRTERFCILSLP
jgi:hypothetical protein